MTEVNTCAKIEILTKHISLNLYATEVLHRLYNEKHCRSLLTESKDVLDNFLSLGYGKWSDSTPCVFCLLFFSVPRGDKPVCVMRDSRQLPMPSSSTILHD